MKGKTFYGLILIALLSLAIGGCGGGSGPASSQTHSLVGDLGTDANGIKYVGAVVCVSCHSGLNWSSGLVTDYLGLGTPGSENAHVYHSDHINAGSAAVCLGCHDPVGDGTTIETLIDPSAVPAQGLAAVTCEACHGAGGQHYGVGAIPVPKPGPTTCGQCHDKQWASIPEAADHLKYHPEGFGILTDYQSSKHAVSIEAANYVSGSTTDVQALCSKCHTDEGAKLYKDISGYDLESQIPGTTAPVADASPVQCRTCHDPHAPNQLLLGSTSTTNPDGNAITISAEVATCTNCHQRYGALHGENDQYVWSGGAVGSGTFDAGSIIYDTHKILASVPAPPSGSAFDATVSDLNSNVVVDGSGNVTITGYAIDPTNQRACRDCHNVHSADITINKEWESSAHAGFIAGQKTLAAATTGSGAPQAIFAAGSNSAPFATYDFAQFPTCQRCHTSTGAKNYLDDAATLSNSDPTKHVVYDPSQNDFSYLGDLSQADHSRELVECWACHSDNAGDLRLSGVVPVPYKTSTVTVPDAGKSDVCVTCHAGLNNNTDIRADYLQGVRYPSAVAHHAAGAATVFNAATHIGFEYSGQVYNSRLENDGVTAQHFEHDQINLNGDSPDTGAGPCASCHMPDGTNGQADHTLAVVTKDSGGIITSINSQALCDTCHTGTYAMTAAKLQSEKDEFNQAVQMLGVYLSNPALNHLSLDITTVYAAAAVTVNDYGALQNYEYLSSADPAAYVHNKIYARRLVFDSLDWLDNGQLDGTVTIDADTYPEAAVWFGASTGTTGPYVASRP